MTKPFFSQLPSPKSSLTCSYTTTAMECYFLHQYSSKADSSLACATKQARNAVAGSETQCRGVQPSECLGTGHEQQYSAETWLVAVKRKSGQ
ncbi:hypothetical protein M441DRAFT_208663 [Trichoderma asperellum CBS 433.97]|uniref:Uncharacterized protein n=1 Tax=Trichoderma asperellum (strain ATCC 204424 / CBS 433.97 / NBRC 101777) TaxID=1042311 RepID=A0A2T3ZMP8_TRIA4|nr:hypothetical protein M441DRAFT_208663 [Trichoderma asperellum CBS 433.97]PTB46077.1 hypothetical protein M441DRAFT_208663 [Trichoderma asperellum CBS 433.97]